jgi:hypothetical protein
VSALVFANEKGLLEELWEYFSEKYFSVDMPYMENFTIKSNALFSLQLIVVGITIGVVIASVMSVYNKKYIGSFIRKLIAEDCLGPDKAKTLEELGFLKNIGVRSTIKSGGSLSRWARCREEDEFVLAIKQKKVEFDEKHKVDPKPPKFKEPEFKRDCNTMHFYLPEEKKYAAEVKFDDAGAKWGAVVLVMIVAIVLCAFICYMLPDALKMIDNFITIMKK